MDFTKKFYFFDKGLFNPYRMSNVTLNVIPAIKEGTIFFGEDEPWEIRYDNSYPNVFYDSHVGKYRCYYSTFTEDADSEQHGPEERAQGQYKPSSKRIVSLCYAESEDGQHWVKPHLGLTEFRGSTANNILGHYLHGSSVLLDEHEMRPGRRYKLFTKIDYGNGIHFLAVAFSADGIHFGEPIKLQDFNPRADTHNMVVYDESLGRYVLVTRTWRDSLRYPCVSVSEDFLHWSPVQEILALCDFHNQIYSMPIFPLGDYYLGLASVFHEGDQLADNYDTVDVHLTYSHQLKGWHYVDDQTPFIGRGAGRYPTGEFDCGCIYASAPVQIGNRTYFYYMGGNGQHTNYRETSLSRAYIEDNHYAYWAVKRPEHPGVLYTNGFIFLDSEIYLEGEIDAGGWVKVELFTADHQPRNVEVALEPVGQGRYRLRFNQPVPRDKTRLRISFQGARLYAIEGHLDVARIESDTVLLRG